ncbi:vacuolar protein sorting-associated protein 33B-like isoform X1 [Pocillopora verrucosa]|uniref:vacuolar protein sorting-associated protein 33B-like isoform X1 n=1 Tax=Pocillopora verrucosa TaxID=203993 RepID=UPI00333EC471
MMAVPSGPKFTHLKDETRDNLVAILKSVLEMKDLVIDPQLMKPLDHFTGASFLKEHGVNKIFKLESGKLEVGGDKRIYLLRPELLSTKYVADHINNDKMSGKNRSYKIVFVPRKLYSCEVILEQEGVYGDVSFDEFQLGFIPLDEDVLTLEIPSFLKDYFLDGDQTSLSFVACSLMNLQRWYGTIPSTYGLGNCAKMVGELLKNMLDEEGDYKPVDGPEIGSLILIDRGVDFVTPLCSQVTYAGVLDDTFGIRSGVVEFGPEVTGKDQNTKMLLNDQDLVFCDIRDRHFSNVFGYLSQKAKDVQSGYDKRQQLSTVSDMRQFVSSELRGLRQQHKGLTLHIGACEVVLKTKTKENFERRLQAEHNMLELIEDKEDIDYAEENIIRQITPFKTLQLLCLMSLTRGGVEPKVHRSLKHKFLQSFGHEHMLTFNSLKQLGLYTEPDKKGTFKILSKRLSLVPKDVGKIDLKNPQDMSYVFSGAYTPISCRLIEQVLLNGISTFEEMSRLLGVEYFSSRITSSVKSSSVHGTRASKCVLVMFLGGCTFSEISALRLLAKKLGYRIIVATTSILNGTRLLESVTETNRK